jgi:hypothetical protein
MCNVATSTHASATSDSIGVCLHCILWVGMNRRKQMVSAAHAAAVNRTLNGETSKLTTRSATSQLGDKRPRLASDVAASSNKPTQPPATRPGSKPNATGKDDDFPVPAPRDEVAVASRSVRDDHLPSTRDTVSRTAALLLAEDESVVFSRSSSEKSTTPSESSSSSTTSSDDSGGDSDDSDGGDEHNTTAR